MRSLIGPHSEHETAWLERAAGAERIVDTSTLAEAEPGRGVFLAHAFTGLMGEDGKIDPNSQARLITLLKALRGEDYGVHCALEREGWGAELMKPGPALVLDMDQVTKADCLVSLPQRSPGAFNELGVMMVSPKPTVLVKTERLDTEDQATSAEELDYMNGTVDLLKNLGVASTMIEDGSTSLSGFEETVVGPVVEWLGQNVQATPQAN